MIQSNKPILYITDDRDGNNKIGVVSIKVIYYTRNIVDKQYEINVIDQVEGQTINNKVLIKSYAEIDGLRQLLLNSGKDYSKFNGTALEDELLADALLMLVQQEGHYHTQPSDWVRI